jgi:hypothetical protein
VLASQKIDRRAVGAAVDVTTADDRTTRPSAPPEPPPR